MVALNRESPRYVIGRSIVSGWLVIDRLTGWVNGFHLTEAEAEAYRLRCENGHAGPPDARRN